MPSERSDVTHPMWRKKMDSSMFVEKCTLIPEWVKNDLFKIKDIYPYKSRKNPQSRVEIQYCHTGGRKTEHIGWVTTTYFERRKDVQRLYFDDDILANITRDFKMSYHRTMEKIHRGCNSPTIENEIQFWEFIDIEFDFENLKFIFVPHYTLDEEILDDFTYLRNQT